MFEFWETQKLVEKTRIWSITKSVFLKRIFVLRAGPVQSLIALDPLREMK